MKNLITIGLPSKGRLKEKAITFFENKGLKITIIATSNSLLIIIYIIN